MAKKPSGSAPASTPATLKKSASSSGQRSITGFFGKAQNTPTPTRLPHRSPAKETTKKNALLDRATSRLDLTPVPSSDGPEPEVESPAGDTKASSTAVQGLPSPASTDEGQTNGTDGLTNSGTPSRRASGFRSSHATVLTIVPGKSEEDKLPRVR